MFKCSKETKQGIFKRMADLLEKMAAAGIIGAAIKGDSYIMTSSLICVFFLILYEYLKGETHEL